MTNKKQQLLALVIGLLLMISLVVALQWPKTPTPSQADSNGTGTTAVSGDLNE